MNKSFKENRYKDDSETYKELRIPEQKWYTPNVLVYFADDSTNR